MLVQVHNMAVGWKSLTQGCLTCNLPLPMPRLCPTILNHAVQLMIWTTSKCWAPPIHLTWEGEIPHINMSKLVVHWYDGLVEDAEALDGPQIENNEENCTTTVPIPEWFISNTWDNINDPSPTLGTWRLTSWHKGDQWAKGMLFKNKASVQYVLTLYSVEHNKQYKVINSDTNRRVVLCIHEACLWSIRARCSKKHGMWQISKCKGPHSCLSL